MSIKRSNQPKGGNKPEPKNPVHKHFIAIEDAEHYEEKWKVFKTDVDTVIKWASEQNTGTDEVKKACSRLKECALIDYERFDFKDNEKFRNALIRLLLESDCMDINFGMKKIPDEIVDVAVTQKPNPLEGKNFISCVMLTGKNYSKEPTEPEVLTHVKAF